MKVALPFDKLAPATIAAASKQLLAKMARAGLKPIAAACDGKTKRVADQSYREVTITFEDNQTLALRVKQTGDVYQVLVNGKVTPVSAQEDGDKAIKELALILDKARAAQQKRLAAMQMKPPEGVRTAAPRLEAALRQQIAEVDQQIEAAQTELAGLQAE